MAASKQNTPVESVKSNDELKKIFQKSLKLLDKSEKDLRQVRKILKKTVSRLVAASLGSNDGINRVLARIKSCVTDTVDLKALDVALDELFVLLNQTDESPAERSSKGRDQQFGVVLKNKLSDYDFSSLAIDYKHRIHALVETTQGDEELAGNILGLINELGIELNDALLKTDRLESNILDFEKTIKQSVFNVVDASKTENTETILAVLAKQLRQYIEGINLTEDAQGEESDIYGNDERLSLSEAIGMLLDSLEIPEQDVSVKNEIIRSLDENSQDRGAIAASINKVSGLVNKSISILQSDKQDLSNFIIKITKQLSDIERYVEATRQQHTDTVCQSAILRDSLDDSVGHIRKQVTAADDICKLKRDVQEHLDTIKENVEKHKEHEAEVEQVSKDQYESMMSELAQSKEQTEQLKQQLETSRTQLLRDALTGLANRMAYNERITSESSRWQRTGEPLCLAMWDIDHFKNINDTFGHDAGDRVLKLFAKIIVGRVRKTDLFARMGGEEFVLLMPNTDAETALDLNNKLRKALEVYKFHYDGKECPVTASVGIAEFREGLDHEEVIKNADKALYISKNSGRNRCTVYTDSEQE